MKYEIIDNVPIDLWDEIARISPDATFYHTPLWTRILVKTFPRWESATWGIKFNDGNQAIFPMLRAPLLGKIPIYWYESMVPGAYGGPIFIHPPQSEHFTAIWEHVQKIGNLLVMGNPYANWNAQGFSNRATMTHIVKLGDFGKVFRSFSRGRRKAVRSAKKQGVCAVEANFDESYETYYAIYCEQLQRWSKKAGDFYPKKLFENIAVEARNNRSIKLWVASIDCKITNGVVVFYHNNQVTLWHAALLGEYFKYRIADLLYSSVIEAACELGYTYLDFGQSGGRESIIFFKEAFGAEKYWFHTYRRRTMFGNLYPVRKIIRSKLRLCPLS